MKVYIIENGGIKGRPDSMMYQGGDGSLIDYPYWTVLIKHPDGNVLFDAASNDYPERQTEESLEFLHISKDQTYPACLQRLGLEPEDIDYLVLSHLHPDHMGYTDLFTNAKVYVAARELEGATMELDAGTSILPNDVEAVFRSNPDWVLVGEDVETVDLLDGLTIYNLGVGHHYGMLGLLIELQETGNVFLPSDACCYLANLDDPPLLPPLRVVDYDNTLATFEKIKKIAKEKDAAIWPAHDYSWFDTMKKSDEGFYQ